MSPNDTGPISEMQPMLAWLATASAVLAILILLWFLIRRPPLLPTVKVILLLGFGVFPILAAFTGNIASFEHSASRAFCAGCHVMRPWTDDSSNPHSNTLPAIHARSRRFGRDNCYTCHEDYGMFGTLLTKLGGLRHVYLYYTEYRHFTEQEAVDDIHILKPFSNDVCLQCHSTHTPYWNDVEEHRAIAPEARSGEASCMSSGCHGPAHPFSPVSRREAGSQEGWGEELPEDAPQPSGGEADQEVQR